MRQFPSIVINGVNGWHDYQTARLNNLILHEIEFVCIRTRFDSALFKNPLFL
ncbi:MAG: hypothetical protein PWR15_1327 [Bacteroidota bacterium]|jgi:hypothetical protein|nr:hypothetical protein [Bacteroidota bacterium]